MKTKSFLILTLLGWLSVATAMAQELIVKGLVTDYWYQSILTDFIECFEAPSSMDEVSKAECPCSKDENKEDANTDFLEFHQFQGDKKSDLSLLSGRSFYYI